MKPDTLFVAIFYQNIRHPGIIPGRTMTSNMLTQNTPRYVAEYDEN